MVLLERQSANFLVKKMHSFFVNKIFNEIYPKSLQFSVNRRLIR